MAETDNDETVQETEAAGTADAAAPEEAALDPAVPAEVAEAGAPRPRRRPKAKKAAPRRPLTPEERQAERVAERRRKAELRRGARQRDREARRAARPAAATTAPREHAPGKQKTRQGVVVSDRAEKTITVRIDVARRHRRYEKIVRTSTTLHAHDEGNEARIGDTVIVRESRPLSRTKRWRLIEIVERAQ